MNRIPLHLRNTPPSFHKSRCVSVQGKCRNRHSMMVVAEYRAGAFAAPKLLRGIQKRHSNCLLRPCLLSSYNVAALNGYAVHLPTQQISAAPCPCLLWLLHRAHVRPKQAIQCAHQIFITRFQKIPYHTLGVISI